MIIGNTGFNAGYAKSVTKNEFVSHFEKTGVWIDNPDRLKDFAKAYDVLTGKKEEKEKKGDESLPDEGEH
ncbi:MAG: hypothetical protein FWF54_03625 [Candidatus Azobacteroides sp.]|nr:hypothetical protein [Candidatus Azobacteroides sp.]